jgi:hypothetical protein
MATRTAIADGIRNAIFDSDGLTASEGADSVTFIRADALRETMLSHLSSDPAASSAAGTTDPDTGGC